MSSISKQNINPNIDNAIPLITSWFIRHHYDNILKVPLDVIELMTYFANKIFDSCLLTIKEDFDLMQLLMNQSINMNQPELLYRASEHECCFYKFHELCDGQGATVTIIETNFGNIIGGYTPIPWSSKNVRMKRDGTSFLFLLRKGESSCTKVECPKIWNFLDQGRASAEFEVVHSPDDGPCFGGGSDLYIKDKCNVCRDLEFCQRSPCCYSSRWSYLDDSLDFTGGTINSGHPGTSYFIVKEYEVFKI